MFFAHYGQKNQFQIHTQRFEWMNLGTLAIGGRGCLFNRAELCQLCDLTNDPTTHDFKIIQSLYRKLGTRFAARLLGEYAYIIWDKVQHHLLCITDHFNNFGIFYSNNTHTLSVSDDCLMLQSLPGVERALNFRKIAMFRFAFDHMKTLFFGKLLMILHF